MTYRIVHLADLHLDVPFANSGRGSQVSNARREGLRQALKRALAAANEWKANALTIGGDLYEAEHVSPDTIQFLRSQFENAAPLRIIIAPGNHDPHTRSSPYAFTDWSPNVSIFREPQLKPIDLTEGLQLWGAGHDTAAFWTPLLSKFRVPSGGSALLLLHGTDRSLSLGTNKQAFCPFSVDEVRTAGFGLALVGHIHHQRLQPAQAPLVCYPGSPEPLGFDEEEGHSILLAEWTGTAWKVETRDISQWVCRNYEVDVSDYPSRDAVVEHIHGLPRANRPGQQCLARIDFVGQSTSSLDLNMDAIRAGLAADFVEVQLIDQTSPPYDIEALRHDTTVTGAFVRRMLVEVESAERLGDQKAVLAARTALRYGLMALDQREIIGP